MTLVPSRFLFRVAHTCRYVKDMPLEDADELLGLPPECVLDNFAAMEGKTNFGEVRLAWNELGIGVRGEVRGKDKPPQGDAARPRASDGLTLWLDTRDARTSHRASRYCYQFHLLPAGGGPDLDEPVFVQAKIHRALHDAPLAQVSAVPFRCQRRRGAYVVEAFLPAAVLNGFDPEQNRRLGIFYAFHDADRGDQTLGADTGFPYSEDPSLWQVLELVRAP